MKSILYDFTPSELQILLDTSDSYSDLLRKIGLNPKGGNPETLHKIIDEYGLDETQLIKNRSALMSKNSIFAHNKNKIPIEDIFSNKVPYHSSYNLLKRLLKEGYKEYKCEKCGIVDWMGEPISLQLEHIDGNHSNNALENLQVLCPNCHSQTDTYAGKNANHTLTERVKKVNTIKQAVIKMPPISRDELKLLIRTTPFIKIGRRFGVSDNAIRKWCDKYKLPRKVSEIHKYTDEEWENI